MICVILHQLHFSARCTDSIHRYLFDLLLIVVINHVFTLSHASFHCHKGGRRALASIGALLLCCRKATPQCRKRFVASVL